MAEGGTGAAGDAGRPIPGVVRDAVQYTVWFNLTVRAATARELLEAIHGSAQGSEEMRAMTVEQYAAALVADARYFLAAELLRWFEGRAYPSDFDRALEYLAAMPTGGVRILARE